MKKLWKIQGFNGTACIFEGAIPCGSITETQLKEMLRSLTAKAGLSYEEIIGAYAKKRTRISNSLLDVRRDGVQPIYLCGDNPHFIANVVDA